MMEDTKKKLRGRFDWSLLCSSTVFLPASSYQQPTWWTSMLSVAIQAVSSVPCSGLLFISCLSPPPAPPFCLSDWSSLFFHPFCLFRALLYSFHSLCVALKANSQSQWAWVTRDKYNGTYNACKLHACRCVNIRHVLEQTHVSALFCFKYIHLSQT